jgi:hypothetical protein
MHMPSLVIERILYDDLSATLRIVYISGKIYDYKKVPPDVYMAMKSSFSKGEFLNKHIKGKYEFEEVRDS